MLYFLNMNETPIITQTLEKSIDNIKQETLCVFCLSLINEGHFTVIEETIKGILDILLLTPNAEETNMSTMCEDCSIKLFAAFDFKTKCVETEDCIFPYINPEKEVDLTEVYLNETGKEHLNILSEDYKICRLCMQVVTCGFIPIKEVDVEAFRCYIPEINFSSTKEPVICRTCLDLVDAHTKFLKSCSETKERIKDIYEDKNSKSVCNIKHEGIEIKSEENDDSESHDLDNKSIDTPKSKLEDYSCGGCKYCPAVEKKPLEPEPKRKKKKISFARGVYICDKCDFRTKEKEAFEHHNRSLHGRDKIKTYECDECDFKTSIHRWFMRHKWSRHSSATTYKCDVCNYTTTRKRSLNNHVATHNLEKLKCDSCEYKTHHRGDLLRHAKRHKAPMYKCDYAGCEFKAIYKKSVQRHLLTHPPKVLKCDSCDYQTHRKWRLTEHAKKHKTPMYKCDYSGCEFKAIYKKSMLRHLLTHPLKVWKCGSCDFQTQCREGLTRHAKRHKVPGELPTYKCEYSGCDFTTIYKYNIRKHLSTHPRKVWKCDSCVFQTRHREGLMQHARRHRMPGDVPAYKCEHSGCDFGTIYKHNIQKHLSLHQQKIFKCDSCDFQTHYRKGLISHARKHKTSGDKPTYSDCQLKTIHKNSFEIDLPTRRPKIWKCDSCSFQTHYKESLAGHAKRHNTSGDVPTYKCGYSDCQFKTIYRRNIQRHLSTHKMVGASESNFVSGDTEIGKEM